MTGHAAAQAPACPCAQARPCPCRPCQAHPCPGRCGPCRPPCLTHTSRCGPCHRALIAAAAGGVGETLTGWPALHAACCHPCPAVGHAPVQGTVSASAACHAACCSPAGRPLPSQAPAACTCLAGRRPCPLSETCHPWSDPQVMVSGPARCVPACCPHLLPCPRVSAGGWGPPCCCARCSPHLCWGAARLHGGPAWVRPACSPAAPCTLHRAHAISSSVTVKSTYHQF